MTNSDDELDENEVLATDLHLSRDEIADLSDDKFLTYFGVRYYADRMRGRDFEIDKQDLSITVYNSDGDSGRYNVQSIYEEEIATKIIRMLDDLDRAGMLEHVPRLLVKNEDDDEKIEEVAYTIAELIERADGEQIRGGLLTATRLNSKEYSGWLVLDGDKEAVERLRKKVQNILTGNEGRDREELTASANANNSPQSVSTESNNQSHIRKMVIAAPLLIVGAAFIAWQVVGQISATQYSLTGVVCGLLFIALLIYFEGEVQPHGH